MRAAAWFRRSEDAEPVVLGAGDLIGRAPGAAWCIDDPRVSEAHALLSLRGKSLWMLALRGRLQERGQLRSEIAVDVGTRVSLAPDLVLECIGVELPERVVGMRVESLGASALFGTTSIHLGPPLSVRPEVVPDAALTIWTLGGAWRAQRPGEAPQEVSAGLVVMLGETRVEFVELPIEEAARTRTLPALRSGLAFAASIHGVRVSSPGGLQGEVSGIPRRIFTELLRGSRTVEWLDLCDRVWPNDKSSPASLRNRLDVGIKRLREKLREVSASEVEIALDGSGVVRLRLPSADIVEFE